MFLKYQKKHQNVCIIEFKYLSLQKNLGISILIPQTTILILTLKLKKTMQTLQKNNEVVTTLQYAIEKRSSEMDNTVINGVGSECVEMACIGSEFWM